MIWRVGRLFAATYIGIIARRGHEDHVLMAFGMFPLDVVIEIDEVNGTRDSVAVDLAMSLICRYCSMIRCHCGGAIREGRTIQKASNRSKRMERRATRNMKALYTYPSSCVSVPYTHRRRLSICPIHIHPNKKHICMIGRSNPASRKHSR